MEKKWKKAEESDFRALSTFRKDFKDFRSLKRLHEDAVGVLALSWDSLLREGGKALGSELRTFTAFP